MWAGLDDANPVRVGFSGRTIQIEIPKPQPYWTNVTIDTLTQRHMIRKGPDGCEVPWHQDEAYWDVEFEYQAVGSWLALHDVPANMGAMQFIPGSHRQGVVEHGPLDGDVERHLLIVDVDVSRAVTCPLRAGGATFHHPRALHNTTPNTTDRARVAFPSKFQTAPVRRAEPAHRRWVDEWRAATGREAATGYQADGQLIPL